MPSLFRFLFMTGLLAGIGFTGLYVMATYFEPEPRETKQPLVGVEIRKP
ncbi:MAG: histidine kinase [Pseudomonadota bacterium]